MSDEKITPPAPVIAPPTKEAVGKEKFIRTMISGLTAPGTAYYARSDRVYIDTAPLGGRGLMLLEGGEFISFLLQLAKTKENILARTADAELIIDHIRYHAAEVATPLSLDSRAAHKGPQIVLNTGWKGDKMLVIEPERSSWTEMAIEDRIFEPIPPEMALPVPLMRPALDFHSILKAGIADFGDKHCLIAVSCATMLLPATFPHPFLVFTGNQARGKSTTMKLLLQLIDPYADGELMTVGDDARDLIALCRGRHCIAMDNVSHLPFDEDLLSKMYSGGLFTARKMTTNSELSSAHMPRLRVMMNGIGTSFSRSDLMSRCIFIEHPALTTKNAAGEDIFVPIEQIERRWHAQIPAALGSLLSAVAEGWKLFLDQGGLEGKTSRCRYVEYAVIGECMSQVMGFEPGLFTKQINETAEAAQEGAIESDDCAQLVLAYLNGERGTGSQLSGFDDTPALQMANHKVLISPTELYKEIRQIATSRNYTIYGMKWMNSVKAFSTAITRSCKNIEHGGWAMTKQVGGPDNRKLNFIRVK